MSGKPKAPWRAVVDDVDGDSPDDCERCFGTGIEVVKGKGARKCGHEREKFPEK